MQLKLQQLSERVMALIKDPSLTDPNTIARLAPLLSKINKLRAQLDELEREASSIKATLDQSIRTPKNPASDSKMPDEPPLDFTRPHRSPAQKIRITIQLHVLGRREGEEAVICMPKASNTYAGFFEFLYKETGIGTLEKLAGCRVSRGPLVTKNPQADYWNPAKENTYQNQPIGDSGYFVLTTNTTLEKAENIQRACEVLGFPNDAVSVEILDRDHHRIALRELHH
jgi:hypothetical protein